MIKVNRWDDKEFFKKNLAEYNSFSAIISGSRTSGKSVFLQYLLVHKNGPNLLKKFDTIIIFSSTVCSGFYDFCGTKLKFQTFVPEVVQAMKNLYYERKSKGIQFRWLCILDDLAYNAKIKFDHIISEIYTAGRHFGCSIFFLTQKLTATNTIWRNNTSLFIICYSCSRKEKIYAADNIITDAIDDQFDELTSEGKFRQVGIKLQSELLKDYNAIIITPFEKAKIHQFTPTLVKIRKQVIN